MQLLIIATVGLEFRRESKLYLTCRKMLTWRAW